MQTETIITTLLSAAALLKEPIQTVATQTLKDLYDATVYFLKRKFGPETESTLVLELATEKPESITRKAALIEESVAADVASDPELVGLIKRMAALLPVSSRLAEQEVHVTGDRNHVQVAGRDIVHTARHVQRNTITPDERHLSAAQRKTIRTLVADLAARLADESGTSNFGAAHARLQRRFDVASYLVLPKERFDEAVAFLRQQRAIHRSRLRRRDPVGYERDVFRCIHARRERLGWDAGRLHEFASEQFGRAAPIKSLTALGPNQLKRLAAILERRAAAHA